MSGATAQPAAPRRTEPPPTPWRRRLLYVGALGVLLVGVWIGAAFVPRWWAHRIGDQVGGSIPAGITLGLVYGFLFTLLPLLVVLWAIRKRRSWRAYVGFLLAAVVLALPNLFTLGIVLGRGSAAHAGDRTLDVEAPGFRGGSLAGAIAAAVLLLGILYLVRSRARTREELEQARARERATTAPQERPSPPEEAT